MKKIYLILPKNPYRRWLFFRRFGKDENQDCYEQCMFVAKALEKDPDAMVMIATNFKTIGEKESEMEYYVRTLKSLGVSGDRIITIYNGLETIHQMKIGAEISREHKAELVIVASWVHWLRVKYMAWIYGIKGAIVSIQGMARPWDLIVETMFVFIYPLYLIKHFRILMKFLARCLRNIKALSFLQ